MSTEDSTHKVAEKTDPSGRTTKTETTSSKTTETSTSDGPEDRRDEPKQIKPDGR